MVAPYLIQLSRTLAAPDGGRARAPPHVISTCRSSRTTAPGCFGAQPTKVGTAKHDYIKGTPGGT